MELIKSKGHKDLAAAIVHVVLNVALAVAVFASIKISSSFYIAIAIVVVSKWRVFAVRRQYWIANLAAGIVDLTVGLGIVGLLYLASISGMSTYSIFNIQIILTLFYIIWLLFIKVQNGKKAMQIQAGIGLMFGSWAIFAFEHNMYLAVVVILMYFVGYGCSRHALLAQQKQNYLGLVSVVLGLLTAELAWAYCHWNISYGLNTMGEFKIPQATIVMLLVGYIVIALQSAIRSKKDAVKRFSRIATSVVAAVAVAVIIVFFSQKGPGIV